MKVYLDLILAERSWSWSLVAMAYLVVTLLVRQLVFRRVVRETRRLDPNVYSAVKKFYLRTSLGGWMVYLLSLLLVIAVWVAWKGPLFETGPLVSFCVLLLFLYFLSVILHLLSFTRGLLAILGQRIGVEKEF